MVRNLLFTVLLVIFSIALTPSVRAAAPDGAGPWADSVVNFSQGQTKSGAAIPAPRSDPTSALGVAENDTVEPHFFSLGFGGTLTLGFDNTFSSAVIVVEATNPGYPVETANVEVSANGSTWVSAGSVAQDGQVTVPTSLGCAKYVRITDNSNAANFSEDTADAFDVDGVRVTGEPCATPTPPCDNTPGCGCGPTSAIISNNGAGSVNAIVINRNQTNSVRQTNRTTATTVVAAKSNTGKNKVSNNTGGSSSAATGNATTGVVVSTTGGTNSSH